MKHYIASQEKTALIVVMTTSFLTPFMGSAINLALPSISQHFSCSAFLITWVVSSYLLSSAAFLLPFGRLADIIGRKKVYLIGVASFSLITLLCGLSWSIESLIAFRIAQGIVSAMIFGTGMAILTSVYPPSRRGKALGLSVASTYVGLSLGPVLGGLLTHNLGWRSIFLFTGLISILAAVYALTRLRGEWTGAQGEKFDWGGSTLYITGILAFLYGLSSAADSIMGRYITVVGIILILLFAKYELHQKEPIIKLDLFLTNTGFAFSNLAAMINYCATFAVGFMMSLYLQIVIGYSSQTAGLILLSQPVIMALLSPLAGSLSDRIEPRLVASAGMGLNALGLFMFIFLNNHTPISLVIINLIIIGLGFALFSSPNSNAVMSTVESRFYGIASSTLGTMRLIGQAISMAMVTLIMSVYIGHAPLNHNSAQALLNSSRTAFIVFTIICIIGVFASLARGNIKSVK